MRTLLSVFLAIACVFSLYMVRGVAAGPAERDTCRSGPVADCVDADGDGWCEGDDCNDGDPAIHPGAMEIPGNGVDENCDGSDAGICYADADSDGHGDPWNVFLSYDGDCDDPGEAWTGDDCDDGDGSIHPGAVDVPDDGIDQDCDGEDATTTDNESTSWSRIKAIMAAGA